MHGLCFDAGFWRWQSWISEIGAAQFGPINCALYLRTAQSKKIPLVSSATLVNVSSRRSHLIGLKISFLIRPKGCRLICDRSHGTVSFVDACEESMWHFPCNFWNDFSVRELLCAALKKLQSLAHQWQKPLRVLRLLLVLYWIWLA